MVIHTKQKPVFTIFKKDSKRICQQKVWSWTSQCYCQYTATLFATGLVISNRTVKPVVWLPPTLFALGLVISNSTVTPVVWLPRDQWSGKYRTDKHLKKFQTFALTLTFNTVIPSLKKFQTFALTLTVNTVIPSFHARLCLMMLQYHTKSGSKTVSRPEDIIQANIHYNFKPLLWPWTWTQQSNLFTRYSCLWLCILKLSLAAKQSAVQTAQQKQPYTRPHSDLHVEG